MRQEYKEMMNILQKKLSIKLKFDESKETSTEAIEKLKLNAKIPIFANNPLLLIDYFENIAFELNSYFETHFRY